MTRIALITTVLCLLIGSSAVARPVHPHPQTTTPSSDSSVNWPVLGIAIGMLATAGVMTARVGRMPRT